jgi:hypothetical protein
MTEGKYIVFTDGSASVFSLFTSHSSQLGGRLPRSAGFFRFVGGVLECYGRSASIGIRSRATDARIIGPLLDIRKEA